MKTDKKMRSLERIEQPTVMSIDWPFMIWNGMDSQKSHEFSVSGRKLPAILFFDNSYIEMSSTAMEDEWKHRKSQFVRHGLCFEAEHNIRTDRGCTSISEFVDILTRKFDTHNADLYHSDSHAFAGIWLYEKWHAYGCKPLKLVMFDQYHDL